MVSTTKKDSGSFIYMRVKKHDCPVCGKQMKIVRMTKTVRSKTKEAKGFSFSVLEIPRGEKIKTIWYEFECKDCRKTYPEDEMREIEKKQKKERRAAAKAEKKAAKNAEKSENTAE
jgi:C4-type Zn-finger protein